MPGTQSTAETKGTTDNTFANTSAGTASGTNTATGTQNTSQITNNNATGSSANNSTTGALSANQGSTTSVVNPFAPQADALTTAFNAAMAQYQKAQGVAAPTDFTAQMTPDQLATFQKMIQQGNDSSVPTQTAATGSTLQTAGANGVSGALSNLTGYNPAATNNTQSTIDAANKYVAGQDIDGQVRDAMLNATQTARDVTLPGIEQNAAIGGNTNSTRTGIADGLVQRGLAQQSAGLGATLRGKAFSDGLTLAEKQAEANNAGALTANTAAGTIGNTAASNGVDASGNSIAQQGALNSASVAGGAGMQQSVQDQLTNLLEQYKSGTTAPYDALNGLMAIIGKQTYGSSTTSNTAGTTAANTIGYSSGTTSASDTGTSSGLLSSSQQGSNNSSTTGTNNGMASGNSDSTTTKTPSAWDVISGLMSSGGALWSGLSGPTPTINTDVGNGAGGHPIVTYR